MTIQDFKTLLSDTVLGSGGTGILTLFNTASATTSTIDAIAIRIGQLTIDDLRQATQLTFRTPSGSNYLHIPLQSSTIPRRLINTSVVENYFVYEIYPPDQRAIIPTPNTGSDGYLEENDSSYLLEPTLTLKRFSTSDYNVLVGSIDESRESTYIVKSDRSSTRTTGSLLNPLNIDSIVAGTAEPADVQDSNYSSTTWTNPRYEGSKITTLTNGNTDPFIQGTFFEGAFFNKGTSDQAIDQAILDGTITYGQNFSAGILEVPRYVVEYLNLYTYGTSAYNSSASLLSISSSGTTPLNKNLQLGDLLVFSGSSSGFSLEALRLVNPSTPIYTPYEYLVRSTSKEQATVRVQRGYSSTPKAFRINVGDSCYRIVKTTIYNIEGTKITPIRQGKVFVKDTAEILYISSDGLVISGSNRINYEDL